MAADAADGPVDEAGGLEGAKTHELNTLVSRPLVGTHRMIDGLFVLCVKWGGGSMQTIITQIIHKTNTKL